MRRLVRGALSVCILGVLLGGVPWALITLVGWPLPRTVPNWNAVAHVLNGASISDAVLIKSLAVATWVIWAFLIVCFATEVRAWVRGRDARDVRFGGLVQPIVRELVVSAALVIGGLRPAGLALTPMVPTTVVAASVPVPPPPTPKVAGPTGDHSPAPTCVVAPRDSLWKLAEDHLGDGLRWRELWELNRGRTFPDGRRFIEPSLINPGWVLNLPSDAVGLATADVPPPATTEPQRSPVVTTSVPTTASPATTLPATTLPATAAPADAEDTPAMTDGHEPLVAPSPADDPDYQTKALLAGSALVAAGLIASLTKLRHRQLRHRTPGRMPKLPGPDAARTEVHLRRAAGAAPFDRLDLALRVLAHCLGQRTSEPCPAISAVSVGPEAIEILLTREVAAPYGPFDIEAGGRAWTLPAPVPDEELRSIADTQAGPAPALVTVGTVDERSVLVDLEAGSRTFIGGDPADAESLLWTLAFELATSNRADDLNLIVVGTPPGGLDSVDRARVVSRIEDVIDNVEVEAALASESVRSRGLTTTLEGRLADPGDVSTPTVVLVAEPQPGLDRLLKTAHDNVGLAVVVAGDADGNFDRELCVEGDTLIVKPVGLRLTTAALPRQVLEDAGELLHVASDLNPGEELDLRSDHIARDDSLLVGPERLPLEIGAHGEPIVPPGHVMVRVLGPVEIIGGQQPIDRRRSVELVTYLALHPEGVGDGHLRTALWPEGAPTQAAFNETVSRARRMLGLDPQGKHHVRHVDNRRYRLGPYVFTDAELLEAHLGRESAADVLRLVRGVPFDGTAGGYEWAFEEGQAHHLLALTEEVRCGFRVARSRQEAAGR